MKIIFFGTTDFAVESLKKLLENKNEILAVVTQPDKPQGRGLKLVFSPVKEFALTRNLTILQPEKLKNNAELAEKLKSFEAELFVVVAYRILPAEIFTLPKIGTFNLHGSLLPKFRGAAPINWAIIKGEKETGVTTFFIEQNVDTGNIIAQEKTNIYEYETFGELYERLKIIGAELTNQTVKLIANKSYKLQKQDESLVSLAPKLFRENTKINWEKDALEIQNFVLGLSPEPCAWTNFRGKNLKILFAKEEKNFVGTHETGELVAEKKRLLVCCKNGYLSIKKLQVEGKKIMEISDFLNGNRIEKNEKFI
ncbi:methionyl-tRNA formyltransferase [bacterium]|nr:methionyl-tRNA formyltransferase [bacterium]